MRNVRITPAPPSQAHLLCVPGNTQVVPSGSYLSDRTVRTPWFQGRDDALAARLWTVSAQLTGVIA